MNFDKLTEFLMSHDTDFVPGLDITVWQYHNEIYRHRQGFRNREKGIPMDGTEQYWIYSATKVFTATAGMQLIEKGVMGPDDPVSKYLPAFGTLSWDDHGHIRAVTEPLTIRHLFTMTGGFSYDLNSPSLEKAKFYSRNQADTLTMVNALAEEPLLFEPGKHYKYSLCHDVLAAVIEVASGMKFSEYLRKNIWEPLGITRTGFTGEDTGNFSVQYVADEKNHRAVLSERGMGCNYRLTDNYESGGAGLYSTVDDYIRLSDALACGGIGKTGARILKPETIDLMRTDQLTPELRKEFLNHTGPHYSYGFGVRTNIDPANFASPKGEFGWDGAANAYTLIDPENKLSIYLGMSIFGFGYGYTVIHHKVRDLVYEGLKA